MSEKRKGLFIAIEGTDGSGKGTQFELLKKRLISEGYDVETFDFPQYNKESSYFARQYLNGAYGTTDEVGPYTASLFFSLDRYEASAKIKEALSKGRIVLTNRFTGSNMAHQGTNFSNPEELRGYFLWLDQIEFDLFKIPRPDLSVVLRVPAEIAQKLVDKKPARSYTDKKRDLHEADLSHMSKSVKVYDHLCQLFPKDFKQIDCTRGGKLLDIAQVESLIWRTLEPYIPSQENLKKKSEDQTIKDNPYLSKSDQGTEITQAGKEYLSKIVTNTDKNVYAFKNQVSQQTIAAAMARLSRRGDDMRVTILDEFAGSEDKDEHLLKRVITAYGDDSVQQLAGVHIVVENASNILTKKLEWGRLGAYLEQSTRYIFFDKKDKNGRYKYFIPESLPKDLANQYAEIMDQIFDNYSQIVRSLTDYIRKKSKVGEEERDKAWENATKAQACDAARATLPVATTSTVGVFVSGQSLESLITRLLADKSSEARAAGRDILKEARQVVPAFLERIDLSDRGVLTISHKAFTRDSVEEIADKFLPPNYGLVKNDLELTDFWPKNELDIAADILYEHSSLSLNEIRDELDKWSVENKKEVIEKYVGERLNRRHKPGRAFEKAHYSFDLVCDYGIFRDLQRHRMVDDLAWQKLTPRYGYKLPELIEEAGLTDLFENCFDLSLKLYSILQANGYMEEAQYATLMGHKMRWKLTFNARQAYHVVELRTSPQGHPTYRKVVQEMYQKIQEVHPLIASGMKFANLKNSPDLSRLEAEKKTNQKLKKL